MLTQSDVGAAHCSDRTNEEKLRSIIASEGTSSLNAIIREIGEQLHDDSNGLQRVCDGLMQVVKLPWHTKKDACVSLASVCNR